MNPRLGAVGTDGDWEGWLDFFLDGVETIGDEAVTTARVCGGPGGEPLSAA